MLGKSTGQVWATRAMGGRRINPGGECSAEWHVTCSARGGSLCRTVTSTVTAMWSGKCNGVRCVERATAWWEYNRKVGGMNPKGGGNCSNA